MTIFANHEYSVRTLNVRDENGNVGCAICGRGESVHRNVTNEIRLTAEDGTEYVLPADFFAGPLKPGTRGKAGPRVYTVVTGKPDEIGNIVVLNAQGTYATLDPRYFTPDPEPPTTVMVEMSVEDAGWTAGWVSGTSNESVSSSMKRTAAAAAEALRKAGL